MSENQGHRGPGKGLLLLIPFALLIARGARRRRERFAAGAHGNHHGFGSIDLAAGERSAFRLPPKLEWMLDAWHTRAHDRGAATGAGSVEAGGAATV